MAQRWSFEEDYIICKYCVEQEGYCWLGDKEVCEMMDRLHAAGFTARSENIVLRRAKQYQELIWTGESRYTTVPLKWTKGGYKFTTKYSATGLRA